MFYDVRDEVIAVTYRGIAKGNTIVLEEALPYSEGQPLKVSVEPAQEEAAVGSPARVREAMRKSPHVEWADVDGLERAIEEGKLAVAHAGLFDARD